MPRILKPSYPNLDAIPEADRDFYVLNTTDNVYELAQSGTEIADYFNRQLAKKRDEFRDEKDRQKREAERLGKEVQRITESLDRARETREGDVARLTAQLERAEADLKKHGQAGSVVLSPEDAKLFERLKKLGTEEDVKADNLEGIVKHVETAVAERETLKNESEQHKREGLYREVAEVQGWNYKALQGVMTHPELGKDIRLEVESVKEGEDTVKKVFVHGKENGVNTKTALADHASKNWSLWMPALEAESAGGDQTDGTKLVKQRQSSGEPGGGEKPGSKLDKSIERFQKERDSVPNPLNPTKAAAQ